jgi:hypothetical protein
MNNLVCHVSRWEAIYLETTPACGESAVLLEAGVQVHLHYEKLNLEAENKGFKSSYCDFFPQFGLRVSNFRHEFGRLIARSHHFLKIGVIFPDREAKSMLPIGSRPN